MIGNTTSRSDTLKFPSARKPHNIVWIIPPPDRPKPPQMLTIHRLQRCSKQRVVDIRCRILQVLPVLDPGFDQRSSRVTHGVSHEPVCRCVSPTKDYTGWKDDERAVWRVCGRSAMGEEVRLEWLEAINDYHTVIVLHKSVAPELIRKLSRSEQNKWAHIRDSSSPAHRSLVFKRCNDGLRILQHGDTVKIDTVCEVAYETEVILNRHQAYRLEGGVIWLEMKSIKLPLNMVVVVDGRFSRSS